MHSQQRRSLSIPRVASLRCFKGRSDRSGSLDCSSDRDAQYSDQCIGTSSLGYVTPDVLPRPADKKKSPGSG